MLKLFSQIVHSLSVCLAHGLTLGFWEQGKDQKVMTLGPG